MELRLKGVMMTAAVAASALVLAACGSGETSSSDAAASAAPAQSAAATAAAVDTPASAAKAIIDPLLAPVTWPEPAPLSKPVDLAGKTVWWVPIGDGVPSLHLAGIEFAEAMKAVGAEAKLCDGKFNPADIGQCLKSAGDQGAAAVVTAYVDYGMIPNAYDDLVKKGIPVLAAAAQAAKPDTATLSFLDNSDVTKKILESVAAAGIAAAGDAQPNAIAVLLNDMPSTTAASKAMIDKFAALCPDCPLQTIDYTTAQADKLSSNISAALVKSPDANVLMIPDDSLLPGTTQALKTAGNTTIKVVSSGGSVAGLQAIKSGLLFGNVGQAANYQPWSMANALFQQLAGDAITPMSASILRYFDASNISELTLDDAGWMSGAWYGDDSFKAAFKAAWGVK